jgi:cytochrome c
MMIRDLMISAVVVAASTGDAVAQDLAAGETAFRKCQICHDVGEAAKNKLGPELNGLMAEKRARSKATLTATPTKTRELYGARRASRNTWRTRKKRCPGQR